jgi:hypothetical protein
MFKKMTEQKERLKSSRSFYTEKTQKIKGSSNKLLFVAF